MTAAESKLSSRQKGTISENRVAEMITLASAGNLSCFKPISDDDGLDLIVCPKGEFQPIFIQVKSRFKLQKSKSFIQNVGKKTFTPHKAFYLLFMLFDETDLEVKALWLIPSLDFEREAIFLKAGKSHKDTYRFASSASPKTKDKWKPYLITKEDKADLVHHVNEAIRSVYGGQSIEHP